MDNNSIEAPKNSKRRRPPKDKALKHYSTTNGTANSISVNPVTNLIDKIEPENYNSKMLLESILIGRARRLLIEEEKNRGTNHITSNKTLHNTKESLIEWAQKSDLGIRFEKIIAFLSEMPNNASPFTNIKSCLDKKSFLESRENCHFYKRRKRAWKELYSVATPYLEEQKLKASMMDRETEIVCNEMREQVNNPKNSKKKKGTKGSTMMMMKNISFPPSPSTSPQSESSPSPSPSSLTITQQTRHIPPDVLERLGSERASVWRIIINQRQQGKMAKGFHQNFINRSSNAKKISSLCVREQLKLNSRLNSRIEREIMLRCKRLSKDQASFWKRFEREEREGRRKAERELVEERRREEERREERRQARKLQFLVNQTELYSHFVAGTKKTGINGSNTTKLKASCDLADVSEAEIKEHAEHLATEAFEIHKKKMEGFESINASNTSSDKRNDNVITQPIMLQATLKPYQLKGLSWLSSLYEQGINGILADEMGLGKTIQAISLMAHIIERHSIWGPFLVVAPASTLHNWQQEIQRFIPNLRALPYWGTVAERRSLRSFWRWTDGGSNGNNGSTLPLGAPQSSNLRHKYTKDSPFHILITSYQLIVTDAQYLSKEKWQYMILDEAQALKSSQSQRWKTLLSFQCRNRLLLTGTPIQNGMQELWALLHFIMPTLFDSHDEFADWFSKDIESHSTTTTTSSVSKLNSHQLNRLHMILRPFMLRRTKMEVIHELAPKKEIDILCHLSLKQKVLTRRLRKGVPMILKNSSSDTSSLMNLMMQLRKTCNHPLLFGSCAIKSPFIMSEREAYWYSRPAPGSSSSMSTYWKAPIPKESDWLPCLLRLMERDHVKPFYLKPKFVSNFPLFIEEKEEENLIDSIKDDDSNEIALKKLIAWKPACQRVDQMGNGNMIELPDPIQSILGDSGKMVELDRLLKMLKSSPNGHRILLYNQMTKMIDIMEEYLQWRKYSYLRLDGSNKISERRDLVHEWQTGDHFIFLLSTRAGGLGINLTAADTVIFYDSDWNPTVDQQAMDRSHRLGQTKPVTVYRLITKNSVEERMRERALQKGEIHNVVIAGGKFDHNGGEDLANVDSAATTTTTTTNNAILDRDELQSLLMEDDDDDIM